VRPGRKVQLGCLLWIRQENSRDRSLPCKTVVRHSRAQDRQCRGQLGWRNTQTYLNLSSAGLARALRPSNLTRHELQPIVHVHRSRQEPANSVAACPAQVARAINPAARPLLFERLQQMKVDLRRSIQVTDREETAEVGTENTKHRETGETPTQQKAREEDSDNIRTPSSNPGHNQNREPSKKGT
jgi:hypothetical protein